MNNTYDIGRISGMDGKMQFGALFPLRLGIYGWEADVDMNVLLVTYFTHLTFFVHKTQIYCQSRFIALFNNDKDILLTNITFTTIHVLTVYPKKYAHGFCFAVLCCGYTLTDFPISIRLTSLALWQSDDCPSASKATLMNMDKYFIWIHYERLHNHNKAKHNKTVCIFLGIYCMSVVHMLVVM